MLDTLFLVSAVAGGAILVLRTLLMLTGIGADHDVPHDDGSGDAGTRPLSIQGLSAFGMMFGLVGLALLRESDVPDSAALTIALLAGALAMWGIAQAFRLMSRLQSSGTLDLDHAIGAEGVVYLTVRPGKGGQVQVALQGRLGIYEARCDQDREIATGEGIRVVDVRSGVMVVEPLAPAAHARLEGGSP